MRTHGHPILTRSLATTLASIALGGTAFSTDGIWKRSSGAWDDPANWVDGQIVDGVDAIADFSTLDISIAPRISLDPTSVRTIGTLKFQDISPNSEWQLGTSRAEQIRLDVGSGQASLLVLNRFADIYATISGDDGINVSNGDGPGGRLRLYSANTFTGGLTVSGGIVQLYHSLAAGTNVITISGQTVETRVDIRRSSPPVANNFVIESGVTHGDGHGAIDASVPLGNSSGPQQIAGTITINGSTGNGGHLFGGFPSRLSLLGAVYSGVPVVQAGGNIEYHGGGDFPELRVTGTAYAYSGGIPATAIVTLGADEMGDGMLSIREPLTLGGLNLGRSGSSNRGVARGLLTLTGDLTAQGTVTHRIEYGTLDLGGHHSIFTVADGSSDIDLEIASPHHGHGWLYQDRSWHAAIAARHHEYRASRGE